MFKAALKLNLHIIKVLHFLHSVSVQHFCSKLSAGQDGDCGFAVLAAPTHPSHGHSPAYTHYHSITIHQAYLSVCLHVLFSACVHLCVNVCTVEFSN